MRGKCLLSLIVLVSLLPSTACLFGPSVSKGVIGYRHGQVFIRRDRIYRVGELPAGWERMESRARAISFYHAGYRSSISTDAFCGRGISDRRLDALGGEIASALEHRAVVSETPFDLDGRGALRQRVTGTQDGVPVAVDLVVVRKNGCVFDFYAVTPPRPDPQVARDFEVFFGAFHYE